ncbi:fatty acyl-CoA reductase 1-like [Cimex lectularius]|uniref:Fatty acyl-CoA reductase n=1 Tax=Cimex lectularius TaxID=79782 RepID=A0A8I6SPP9_CIMLE|nr:fatty acyl-CoA reductase 1-like [Cimex lectularius]XP_024084907.1 fatty acyl-CoA reductase 1-like [Cimex lectularius]
MATITEYFAGKKVLVTGATGFMGKVLIEKLLRSCPDVGLIYVIIRDKKGQSAQERWDNLTKLELFNKLKEEIPGNLEKKVKVLNGDIFTEKFGLSKESYEDLKTSVSIVYHVAATVKFNEPIEIAMRTNVGGTRTAINFALEVKNLEVFVHVSTAYSNCNMSEVEEKVYPPIMDWRQAMNIIKDTDPSTLKIITKKFISPMPNTYVFSKHLAEQVVNETKGKIPIVIFRPSIVISSWKGAYPGWIDNANGPTGMFIGMAKGVVRVQLADEDATPDYMPVDVAINALIIASWKKGRTHNLKEKLTVSIYNSCTGSKNITLKELRELCLGLQDKFPIMQVLWYPRVQVTKNESVYRIASFFKHFLPALTIDTILMVLKKPPLLLPIQKKVMNATLALKYFTLRKWTFHNDNFTSLLKEITPEDYEAFDFNYENGDVEEFLRVCIEKGRHLLLNETTQNIEMAKRKHFWLYFLDVSLKIVFALGLTYILYSWCF